MGRDGTLEDGAAPGWRGPGTCMGERQESPRYGVGCWFGDGEPPTATVVFAAQPAGERVTRRRLTRLSTAALHGTS